MKKKKLLNFNTNFYVNPIIDYLNNGLDVVTDRKETANTFAVGFLVKSGSSTDMPGKSGLAHLTEHLVFRNTKVREGRILANKFEDLGAFVNAFTTKEYTIYFLKALNEHFEESLDLLFELVYNPNFRGSDLDKEKMIIKEEILSYEDDPEESIIDHAEEILYEGHPLSSPILGNANTIDNINLNDVLKFHENHYTSSNTIFSYSGNLENNTLLDILNKYTFIKGEAKLDKSSTSFKKQKSIYELIEKNYSQSQILKYLRIDTRNSTDLLMMELFNISFGEGISSRLYQNIREKKGLTYNIYSGINNYKETNTFYIYTATDNINIKNVSSLIDNELEDIIKLGLSKVELNRAKELYKTNLILEIEDTESRMLNNARNLSVNEEEVNIEMKLKTLDQINLNIINDFISKIISREDFNEIVFT